MDDKLTQENPTRELLSLLGQERELFLKIEVATEAMCVASAEEIEQCVNERQRYLDEIAALKIRLHELGDASGEAVVAALQNSCGRNALTGDLAALYDASMAVKAVANRIQQYDEEIREHVEMVKEEILKQIEKMNQSGNAVASRYQRSVELGIQRPASGSDRMI